jgi:tetratricopeptide (TPR) repeat protein
MPEIKESSGVAENFGKRSILVAAPALFVITFLVFLPALNNGFVNWDDPSYIYNNTKIQSFDLELFRWAFSSVVVGNWHPLTLLSHAVDYALFGLSPGGHHFTSVLIHSINTSLVFVVSVKLFGLALSAEAGEAGERARLKRVMTGAFFTALLFGLHPLRVESVAWVSERKDLLCALFYILSVIAYLRYATVEGARSSYVLALVFLLFSLMSKPMAVSLPVVLIILDFYPLRRFGTSADIKRLVIEKLPFFALGFVFSLVTLFVQRSSGAVSTLEAAPFVERLLVAARAYAFYIYKTLLPIELAPLYPYPKDAGLASVEFMGSVVLVLALSVIAVISVKRFRAFTALWAYFLVTLIPVIGIVQVGVQGAADRYTYLPGLGAFMLAGAILISKKVYTRLPFALIIIGVIVVSVVLALKTRSQVLIWKSSVDFWTYELRLYPEEVPKAYINRASAYEKAGQYKLQKEDLDRAVELDPLNFSAYNNRGSAYGWLGEFELAAADFRKAIELDPGDVVAYRNLAWALTKTGDFEGAIVYYKLAAAMGSVEAERFLRERGL